MLATIHILSFPFPSLPLSLGLYQARNSLTTTSFLSRMPRFHALADHDVAGKHLTDTNAHTHTHTRSQSVVLCINNEFSFLKYSFFE